MEINECSSLVDSALAKLRSDFAVSTEDGGCRVVAPILRRDGDPFEVLVRVEGDQFVVSDEGDTFDYLQLSGIKTRKNRALERLVSEIRSAHEVTFEQGAVVVRAEDIESVGSAIVRAIAAMSDISQFELTRREAPPRTFDALVEGELVGQNVPYQPRVTYEGAVRERSFRFGINGSRKTVVEPLRAPNSSRAGELAAVLIVNVEDVWRRNPELAAIAVIDDRTAVWSERAVPDLTISGLNVVRWSLRHQELGPALASPQRGTDRRT